MIYIIGSGAIGKSLAAFLTLSDVPVSLVRASVDQQPEAIELVRVQLPEEESLSAEVPVMIFSQLKAIDGPVLVASKAFANAAVAAKLFSKGADYPVMLLQNGLNIERPFIAQGFTRLYRCVLMVTAQFASGGLISFKPVAPCPVGVISGEPGELAGLLGQLHNPWFPFTLASDIQPMVWKKVITNCVFNSICPLLETDNGIFYRNTAALNIADRVIAECIAVARRCQVELTHAEVRAALLSISERSQGQLISTLQDIRKGRPTEIGMLNLEIARLAGAFGMENLVQQTRILGELIAIKSGL